jgi:hypothetical protein
VLSDRLDKPYAQPPPIQTADDGEFSLVTTEKLSELAIRVIRHT